MRLPRWLLMVRASQSTGEASGANDDEAERRE
jgi:hypothetical protein